jgi:hypothetical protein
MDEPERLLEQTGSALGRAVLMEGRHYRVSNELRVNTLAALGLAATASVASVGALVWLATKSWTTKLLLAMSALTVVVVIPLGYVVLRKQPRAMVPAAPAMVPRTAPATPPTQALDVESAPAPRAAGPVPSMQPSTTRAIPANPNSALRAELAALDAIRSTLANHDARGALSFLDAYFRTFPRGRLRLEAEVLRIDALAKAGRVEAAHRSAKEFIARHPNSVLTARVQTYARR